MPSVRKRIEGLEKSMARMRGPDPYDAIQRLALQSLPTEDLTVLIDVIEQGRRKCEWTERDSTASSFHTPTLFWAKTLILSKWSSQPADRPLIGGKRDAQHHGFLTKSEAIVRRISILAAEELED
jgi:hypothetical protein